ncbi:hypothetical protein EDD86DRAFT_140553 [Gorgonomyces haynaldii]|nr:hypothetical protein EDD86DRAFT_140553 [Gorgonomyces haynaldii]
MRTFYLPFLEPKHVEKELVFEKQETKPITNVIDRANRFFTTSKEVLGDPIPQVFDLNLVVNPADQSLKQYKLQLVEAFMDFYNEPIRQEENEIPDALYGKWKETKLKYGIQAFKKKIQIGQSPAELYQTRTQIQCDSTRVVGVLSNPKHLHHMYDTIESDKILSDDPLVVRLEMNLQKQQKSITFMEAKQTIDNATIIVMRSVATVHEEPKENGIDIKRKSLASPPNSFGKSNQIKECPVYIYGYHVKPHLEDPNQCFVTCISCFNHELKPLETDIQPMRKLKAFIEELANITDNSVKKKNEQDSLDKLKNYVGMAQQFFKQKTQFKSTESVEQEDLDKSSEKVSEKSFEKVSQSVSEKLVEKVSQHVSETLVERTAEKLVEKTAESVVETAAVGAVEKTAEKPLIVEELVDKVEIEAEEPQSMAESDTTQEFTIIQPNKDQEKSEKEMMDSLHSLDHAYFVDEPYIERIIGSREICSVAIPYNGQGTQFSFEFMSRMEHLPMFGLHFHPDQKTTLLPMEEGHCVLFPMATVQAYTRPAHCTFPLDNLPHGTFYLIWDNQSIMSKNREKQITYKAMIRHTPKSIWSISVTISRKSYYKLPILVSGKSKLDTDFESQGIEIPFSMSFSPINTNLVTVLCPKKRMCHLIGSGFESIDVTGLVGTITLEWDNTQSLISSRQVTFNIKLQ